MQSRVKTRGKWETIEHTPKKSTGEKTESVVDKTKQTPKPKDQVNSNEQKKVEQK